jgi:cytochrome c peroxidase
MLVELFATIVIPLGLDLFMPVPEGNPLTPEKIELGQRLFLDPRLSRDGSISCATCHNPTLAFADGRSVAIGIFGRPGRRNAPALINRGYGRSFFWDGRVKTLEDQVLNPINDPNEMGFAAAEAAARVGLGVRDVSQALASYVRSILSGNSRYDRYINGDRTALTAQEQEGLKIFRGKGNCVACHVGPNLTDEALHNTGVGWRNNTLADAGGGRGEFKTPTLREVARTAPYMHDGSIPTLEAVVDFYAAGGRPNPWLDPEIRPRSLNDVDKEHLAAFLRSLDGVVQEGSRARARPDRRSGATGVENRR